MFNNVVRTCIEAMAATQGGTQSLHTNALDEALALPSDFSARIARNTQLVLQRESGTTRIIDPWGGSYYVERLTGELARRAWSHIREVEDIGGMAKAIEAGLPKQRIEEAAAKTQARIDGGLQAVVGVNRYRPEHDAAGRSAQGRQRGGAPAPDREARRGCGASAIRRRSRETLAALTRTAGGGNENLLALAVDAARVARHRRRDLGGTGDGVRAARGRAQGDLGRLPAGGRRVRRGRARAQAHRRVRRTTRAAVRASWSPRSARTATTAARR